ncbi:hypothetical protein, partial [Pseudomonas lactis]|uniref:hypothetical protein n=1 Tax=Pseudomonas lactis TaxID=1615674 RepID=UPI001EE2EA35
CVQQLFVFIEKHNHYLCANKIILGAQFILYRLAQPLLESIALYSWKISDLQPCVILSYASTWRQCRFQKTTAPSDWM